MASSGNHPDEGEAASSATAATDEVDGGWGGSVPPARSSKSTDEPGESEVAPPAESPPVESPPAESAPAESPRVESPPVEPPRVESAPAESPRIESAPVEPPPAESAPVESPPVESLPVELPPVELPPVELPRVKPPPVESSPAESPVESPRVESSPSIEVRDESGPLAAFWSARPSGAWLAVGGGAIVVAFVVGIFTGRGSQPEPEVARPALSSNVPAPPAVVAPTPPPAEPREAPSASPSTSPAPPKHAPAGFNAKAAKLAIDKIVSRLKGCRQPGEPPGSATVTVTFAPSGRVSDARVTTTRYAGTRTGSCISQRLREARVPEFSGSPVTVKRSVAVR